jgi:pimeloyl-ACP methyl ester carboxylesterase
MSTTGNPGVGRRSDEAVQKLLAPTPPDRDQAIEHITDIFRVIGSKTHAAAEEARRRRLAEASYDRSFYPQGSKNQFAAILHARDRTADLGRLTMPTLVVHGAEDSLIDITGGEATHDAIPDSEYLPLSDMGHDLPEALWPELIDGIVANAERAADTVAGSTAG